MGKMLIDVSPKKLYGWQINTRKIYRIIGYYKYAN